MTKRIGKKKKSDGKDQKVDEENTVAKRSQDNF